MLFERYHPRPPTTASSQKLGVHNSTPKLQSLLSQKWIKLRTSNVAGVFLKYPLLSQERAKLRTSNQILHIHSQDRSEQKPVKNFGKSSRGLRDYRKFSGHPYIGHRAVIFAVAQLSCHSWQRDSACRIFFYISVVLLY